MKLFENSTLGTAIPPLPVSGALDMEKIHDIAAAAGSGRFYGGGYPPYYNGGYYPMGPHFNSVAGVVVGLALLGIVFIVVYWLIVLFVRLQQRAYYGVRKKRSTEAAGGESDLDILLSGGRAISDAESWRNHVLNGMLNDDAELDLSARIVGAIEEKSLDYD